MTQLSIQFEPSARASDPATSHQAAQQARELAARHHALIVDVLHKHGPLGKDGIAWFSHLDGVQVCRRVKEMHIAGLIQLTGNTVQSNTGRQEREWTVSQAKTLHSAN